MGPERTRINTRILVILGAAALAVAALGLWGISQPSGAKQQASPLAVVPLGEAAAKTELRRLLTELDAFKSLEGFHSGAFSDKGLPQAARWHKDATALRDRISGDASLPPALRAAPGQLLGLGLAYQQSKGKETAGTESDRKMVLEALK